jgi:hypothetical protein
MRREVDVVRRGNGVVLIRREPRNGKSDLPPHKAGEVIAVTGVLGLGGELTNLNAETVSTATTAPAGESKLE